MNALLIVGDYWHAAGPYEHALREAWSGLEINIRSIKYPLSFDPADLSGQDIVVLCAEGRLPNDFDHSWIQADGEAAIEKHVRGGATLLGWHSGLVNFAPRGPLHALYGGAFNGHPPEFRFPVVDVDGAEIASLDDEFYQYDVPPADARITHWINSPEHGREPAAWTRRIGKGRVACLTLAHNRPGLRLPVVQELLRKAATG